MSLFRGYTQQRGFKPITVPDPAEKIRQQGRRKTQYMQAALNAQNKQTARLVNAMRYNANAEEKAAEENFKLQQEYGDILAKAKMKQYDTIIAREQNESKANEERLKSILSFTQTGLQAFQQIQQQRAADNLETAQILQIKYGIGSYKTNLIRNADAAIFESGTENLEWAREAGLEGTPWDVIMDIRNADGATIHAINKLHAVQVAREFAGYLTDNDDREVELYPGAKLSLNNATRPEDYTAVQRILLSEYIKDAKERGGWKDPKLLVLSGADGILNRIMAEHYGNWNVGRQKATDEQLEKDASFQLVASMDADANYRNGLTEGLPGLYKYAERIAINSARVRTRGKSQKYTGQEMQVALDRAGETLFKGLENGDIDPFLLLGLDKLRVPHSGSDTPVFISDITPYWRDTVMPMVKDAINKKLKVLNVDIPEKLKADDVRTSMDLFELLSNTDTPLTLKDLGETLETLRNRGLTLSSNLVAKSIADTTLARDNRIILAQYEVMKDSGEVITPTMIEALKAPAELKARLLKDAEQENGFLPYERSFDTKGRPIVVPNKNYTYQKEENKRRLNGLIENAPQAALDLADTKYKTAYKAHMAKHGSHPPTAQDKILAHEHAESLLTKEFNDALVGKGDFAPVTVNGIKYFAALKPSTNTTTVEHEFTEIQALAAMGFPVTRHTTIIEKQKLTSIVNKINKGETVSTPNMARTTLSIIGGDSNIYTLYKNQIEHHNEFAAQQGLPLIPEITNNDWIERNKEALTPITDQVRWYLNCPNPASINLCYAKSNQPIPYINKEQDKLKTLIFEKSGGNYDTDGLSNLTLREVRQHFEENKGYRAGAYNITLEQFNKATENMSDAIKFSEGTQDLIFDYLSKNGLIDLDDLDELDKNIGAQAMSNIKNPSNNFHDYISLGVWREIQRRLPQHLWPPNYVPTGVSYA